MRKQEKVDYITARFNVLNPLLGIQLEIPLDPKLIPASVIDECYKWLREIMTTKYRDFNLVRNLHTPAEWQEIFNHLVTFEEERIYNQRLHELECAVKSRTTRPQLLRKTYVKEYESAQKRKAKRQSKLEAKYQAEGTPARSDQQPTDQTPQ